jgi:hypothetical protein
MRFGKPPHVPIIVWVRIAVHPNPLTARLGLRRFYKRLGIATSPKQAHDTRVNEAVFILIFADDNVHRHDSSLHACPAALPVNRGLWGRTNTITPGRVRFMTMSRGPRIALLSLHRREPEYV